MISINWSLKISFEYKIRRYLHVRKMSNVFCFYIPIHLDLLRLFCASLTAPGWRSVEDKACRLRLKRLSITMQSLTVFLPFITLTHVQRQNLFSWGMMEAFGKGFHWNKLLRNSFVRRTTSWQDHNVPRRNIYRYIPSCLEPCQVV